ncbi:uncharacterized protein LOC143585452 [Bidens hawaiensis]|uniref:uncharacterized protein LOC143585452 n=1 Tax=Bidens hawaiensis TaxID=980011 RepID=UPI00404A7C4A
MEVSDISGDSVFVTLWGDYVSQFSKYVVDHFDESHMIILMQFGRVKYHKEKPYVSNSYGSDVTRVFLNESISEIEDYKTRLFEFLDSNVDGAVHRPILPKSIIVLGTIKAVCPDSEWYYVGCNTCSRKVIVNVVEGEDVYECKNQRCNTLGVTPTPRSKIRLRVQDGSGVVSLTLFDRDAKLIINKTTSELLATKDEVIGFPSELNCLLEKKFAFKVEIADFNFRNNVEVYGISKLTDDQQILAAIEKRLMPEFIVPSDYGTLTFGNSLTNLQSTSSTSLKISDSGDNKTPVSYRLVDDEVNEIKLSSSDSDEKLKRKLVDVFDGDQPSGFSSTKSKTSDVQDDSELVSVVGSSKNGVKFLTPKVENKIIFVMTTSFLMQIEDPKFPIQEIPKEFILQNSVMFNILRKTVEIDHYKGSSIVELKKHENTVCFGDGVTDLMCSLKIRPYERIIFILFEDESKWLVRTPSKKAISTGHRQAFVLYDHKRMNDKLVVSKKNIESQFQDTLQIGFVQDLAFRDGDVLWLKYVNTSTVDLIAYEKNGNLPREPLSDVSNTTQSNNLQNVHSNPPNTSFFNGYSYPVYASNQYGQSQIGLLGNVLSNTPVIISQNYTSNNYNCSSCVISSNISPNVTSNFRGSVSNHINHGSTSSKRRVGRPRETTHITPIPMQQLNDFEFIVDVFKGISTNYIDHGDQSFQCESCNACLWELESKRGKKGSAYTTFSLCCRNENVKLPDLKQPHETYVKLFRGEDPISKYFLKNIRRFNSMFSFTSMGGKVNNSINRGNAPYTFRLGGENYHSIGSLLPLDGNKPQFAQLYIYDTENEISNRQKVFGQSSSDAENYKNYIITYFKETLDSQNPLVQAYRMVRDTYKQNPHNDFKLRIVGTRKYNGRTYNLPTASEVAALIVGDIGDAMDKRDIIVNSRSGGLRRISELHPSYTPLQFPLIYPFGEDGYKVDIAHRNVDSSSTAARKKVTMREFFAYRLQDRPNQFSLPLNGRRLFQQLLVDKYTMVESQRLNFIRGKQSELRSDTYESLRNLKTAGNSDVSTSGQRVILPSSFTGGSRYMMQNYLDAMCLCRWVPAVTRLPFHLPCQQQVIYGPEEDIEDVLTKTSNSVSMFTGWMKANRNYEHARRLSYAEFPTQDACYRRGLLDDDKEYIEAIEEASHTANGYYLRNLFATMLITSSLSRPDYVWDNTWQFLVDGILYHQQKKHKNPGLSLSDEQLKNLALLQIEEFLVSNNSSLRRFSHMPFPDQESVSTSMNPFMMEELSYDKDSLSNDFKLLYTSLTDEQKKTFTTKYSTP